MAWTDLDRKIADQVSSYWVNFAATGDPNGKGLQKWPAYRAADDQALGIGDAMTVIQVPHKAALDFLDVWVEKQRSLAGRAPTGQPR